MKPNVLIVEDDFIQAANLAEVVQQDLDAEPLAVASVSEALKVIPDNIDLAILDIELVDGKSYPVARKLIHNEIPVIFVSANAQGVPARRLEGHSVPRQTVRPRHSGAPFQDAHPRLCLEQCSLKKEPNNENHAEKYQKAP